MEYILQAPFAAEKRSSVQLEPAPGRSKKSSHTFVFKQRPPPQLPPPPPTQASIFCDRTSCMTGDDIFVSCYHLHPIGVYRMQPRHHPSFIRTSSPSDTPSNTPSATATNHHPSLTPQHTTTITLPSPRPIAPLPPPPSCTPPPHPHPDPHLHVFKPPLKI